MKRILLAALLFSVSIPATAFAGDHEEAGGDESGLMVGLDGGYSMARGHEYGGQLEDALDVLHLYAGYRAFGLFSFEVGALDIQAPIKGSNAHAQIRVYSLDGRLYIPMGPVQPNVLLGYAPTADLHVATGSFGETLHGYSWNAGAGCRFMVMSKLYVTLDFRHMFIRHTRGEINIGGVSASGTFGSEQRGDISTVLVGGGLQF